ncbi:thiopeptide-type bacteriocin biosynthesis protein [Actinoallomurus sp. NPDC050550]|uniref:thiopeptide-type bacteriocin biosynthesis protein n=1 Tax=Actinoallomurus sp. NPDC050550 TaxID=3154937 RepID=UPI0033F80668
MQETPWKQVNITYVGSDPHQRERHAISHLAPVLPAAEAYGLITSWWFIRKHRWRVRYLLTEKTHDHDRSDPLHPLLTAGVTWTDDIYEPEIHAFGGPDSMNAAHALFHHDSRHLLTFLHNDPADRREHSLVLCTALMRTAGLDWNEQGDVWARVAEQRAGLPGQPSGPAPQVWASFTSNVRHLLLGTARTDTITGDWLTAFEDTGRALRTLRENGELTRGLRAVIALHVIFHWNRIGLPATTQATLARAAKEAVIGSTRRGSTTTTRTSRSPR